LRGISEFEFDMKTWVVFDERGLIRGALLYYQKRSKISIF
jgi:hypothetical protein